MAPGSEHLQRMRESLAVVNGRQGSSESSLLSAHLSIAVLDTTWQQLPRGRGASPMGPGARLKPQLGRCALLSINIDTDAGEGCGGSLHTVTLSGVRGCYTGGRLDEGLSAPEPPSLGPEWKIMYK